MRISYDIQPHKVGRLANKCPGVLCDLLDEDSSGGAGAWVDYLLNCVKRAYSLCNEIVKVWRFALRIGYGVRGLHPYSSPRSLIQTELSAYFAILRVRDGRQILAPTRFLIRI